MTPHILALGCALVTERVEVSFDGVGWEEEIRLEVGGADACRGILFDLPDGVVLGEVTGRVRPADDPAYRLDAHRLERVSLTADGRRVWQLHLPELRAGDVAIVEVERRWTRPVDYAWTPSAAFTEVELPRRLAPDRVIGLRQDKRVWWADRPEVGAALHLPHPWEERAPAPLPPVDRVDLPAAEAHARVARLVFVDEAFFGRSPPVGADALALGVGDRRTVARTLAALAADGPDAVALGRWSPDAATPPRPGALEAAVHHGPDGARVLLHPDDPGLPDHGVLVTPTGAVALADAPVVRPAPVPHPVAEPEVDLHLAFEVEGRAPLAHLGDDDDLHWQARYRFTWPTPTDAPWARFVPLPPGLVEVLQPLDGGCSRLREGSDAVWLVAAPGTSTCTFTAVLPLRDAWGFVPWHPEGADVTAHAAWRTPEGHVVPGDVVLEDGAWRVVHLADRQLLTDRERLEAELAERFRAVGLPEPGVPGRVRQRRTGWELAAATRELLAWRAVVADLPVASDRPRRLHAARRGRVLTRAEAAMVGAMYLRQQHLDATWALARPRPLGPSAAVAPVGFTEGLIRVEHEGKAAWIDPACAVCAPFEIRPELVGAELIGHDLDRVGDPPRRNGLPLGIVEDVVWTAAEPMAPSGVGVLQLQAGAAGADGRAPVTLTLVGAAALELRLALEGRPDDERQAWLQDVLDADAPVEVEGLEVPGAPVVLRTVADPTRLDVLGVPADGSPWVGLLREERPVPGVELSFRCEDPDRPFALRAHAAGGVLTEAVLLRNRELSDDDRHALALCRAAVDGLLAPDQAEDEVEETAEDAAE